MTSWEARIEAYWSTVTDTDPDETLHRMRDLVAERPRNDPEALYEWASVHDYLGLEAAAVPLYRAALDNGLDGPRRPQAVIQLASSLRNIGQPDAAVELLQNQATNEVTGDAAQAFLSLALRDLGRHDEALKIALKALARTLPLYQRVIEAHPNQLAD